MPLITVFLVSSSDRGLLFTLALGLVISIVTAVAHHHLEGAAPDDPER